jgi:hypothetical protein
MVTFTLHLPPLLATKLIAMLTTLLMTTHLHVNSTHRATVTQQHADNLDKILTQSAGTIDTEIVIHVRADGYTSNDGTPLPASIIENIADTAFIRALIHDSSGHPIDATNRRGHPTLRQKRLVKERHQSCIDCGRTDLLEYDHNPPHNSNSAAPPATTPANPHPNTRSGPRSDAIGWHSMTSSKGGVSAG